jgi:hypothetical protein
MTRAAEPEKPGAAQPAQRNEAGDWRGDGTNDPLNQRRTVPRETIVTANLRTGR